MNGKGQPWSIAEIIRVPRRGLRRMFLSLAQRSTPAAAREPGAKTAAWLEVELAVEPGGMALADLPVPAGKGVEVIVPSAPAGNPLGQKPLGICEMNLVLTDGRRIPVSRHAGPNTARTEGTHLAEFLGVPLLNHMDADGRWQ